MAHPTQLNPNEQDTLVKQIGMALLRAMPPEWRQVRTSYRAIGRYSEIVGEVRIAGDSTAQQWSVPPEIGALFTQLRSGMYREGRGTWFNAHYQLDHPSRYNLDYDREEPRWQVPPPPAAFGDELRIYPRTEEHVPEWLVRRLAGAGPGTPAAAEPRPFRLARTFDGPGPNGPVVNRPPIADGEFDQLRHYLESAPVAVPGQNTDVDLLDPSAPAAVPLATHTDGSWLWPAAVGYYLREHRLPPDPQLLAHIRDRRFVLPDVDDGAVAAAAAFVAQLAAGGPEAAAPARNGTGPRFGAELPGFDRPGPEAPGQSGLDLRPPGAEPREGQQPDSPPRGLDLPGSAPRGFGQSDPGRPRPFGELSRPDAAPRGFGQPDTAADPFGEPEPSSPDSAPLGLGARPFGAPADPTPRGFEPPDEPVEPRGPEANADQRHPEPGPQQSGPQQPGPQQPGTDGSDPAPRAFELPSALDPRGAGRSGPMAQPHIESAGPNGAQPPGPESAHGLPDSTAGPLRLPPVPLRPPLAARLRTSRPTQPGGNVPPEFGMDFPTPIDDPSASAWFSGDGVPSAPPRRMAGRSPFEPFIEADAQATDAPESEALPTRTPASPEPAAEPLAGLAPFDPERMLDALPTRPPGFSSFTPTGPGAVVEPAVEDGPTPAADEVNGGAAPFSEGDSTSEILSWASEGLGRREPSDEPVDQGVDDTAGHEAGADADAAVEPTVDEEAPAVETADDEPPAETEAPVAPTLRTFDEPDVEEPEPERDDPVPTADVDRTAVLPMPTDPGDRVDDRHQPATALPSTEPPAALFQALRDQLTRAGVTEADYRIGQPMGTGWTLEQAGDQWRVGWFDGAGYVAPALFSDAADAAAFLLGKTLMARQETPAPPRPAIPTPVPVPVPTPAPLPPLRTPNTAEPVEVHQEPIPPRSNSDWPIRPMAGEPPLTLFRGKRLVELAAGTTVDRYGDEDGNLTYAAGTPFPSRSLVPDWINRGYHVYRLTQPVQVLTGTAIPWFDQPGGGTAYLLPESVDGLLAAGVLADLTESQSTRPAGDR